MTTASLIRVANLDELHGDGPHALSASGFDVVAVRTPAGVRAFEGRCPHQGALLGEGELDGDKLVCRNHRWRFSVDSGQREGGPQCLASCPVVERERAIFVDVSGLSRGPARSWPSAHWTICQVRKGWATFTSSTRQRLSADPAFLNHCILRSRRRTG